MFTNIIGIFPGYDNFSFVYIKLLMNVFIFLFSIIFLFFIFFILFECFFLL